MYKCKCGKEFEKKGSLTSHARFCSSYEKETQPMVEYKCECGREFKKAQSLNAHYSHCLIHRGGTPEIKRGGWKISDEVRKKQRQTLSDNIKAGKTTPSFKNKHHSDETKEHLSRTSKGWTNGFVKTKFYEIYCPYLKMNVNVQGTYELRYAQRLNSLGINWIKSKEIYLEYKLSLNDITRTYFPDFYLPDANEYVEIKGYFREQDKLKMTKVIECNPDKKIKILGLSDFE